MKISEIKNEELRVLAKVRATQHAEAHGLKVEESLSQAFIWDVTPERVDFWAGVQMGEITEIKTDMVKETIDILNDTIESKDKELKSYMQLVEVLEGRINSLSEFNNALIGML